MKEKLEEILNMAREEDVYVKFSEDREQELLDAIGVLKNRLFMVETKLEKLIEQYDQNEYSGFVRDARINEVA